jgi:CheY-like chemotaxis protein
VSRAEACHVCVIDDDGDIRDAIRFVLENEGFEVSEAADGAEGLTRIREDHQIGLILLDLMMPKMSGWEFRKAQLQNPELASIPVIVLSGATRVAEHAKDLSVDGYLLKPVDRMKLLETVERYC